MPLGIANVHQTQTIMRHMRTSGREAANSMARLSSGFRINVGADAPADLVISEQLRSQLEGLKENLKGTRNQANMLDTEDGILANMQEVLRKMKKLAMQAANDGVAAAEQLAALQAEMDSAVQALAKLSKMPLPSLGMRMDLVDRRFDISGEQPAANIGDVPPEQPGNRSGFDRKPRDAVNGDAQAVLGDIAPADLEYLEREHVDVSFIQLADEAALEKIRNNGVGMSQPVKLNLVSEPQSFQLFTLGDLMGGQKASLSHDPVNAMKVIDAAIKGVADTRARLAAERSYGLAAEEGMILSRMEHLARSESFIRDTAMATEIAELTRNQIRQQVCVGLLAQVNMNRGAILSLLQ